MASVSFEDFSGGLTDYPMNAGKNKCKRLDNISLRQYEGGGKPFTRPGSEFANKLTPQLPTGDQRISTIFEHENRLFCQSGQRLFYLKNGAWVEVNGLEVQPFPEATNLSNFSTSKWGSHLLITHSPHSKPSKLYIDQAGTPIVATAGLPKPKVLNYPVQPEAGQVIASRLFKITFSYIYTTEGEVTFEDVSEPSLPLFGGSGGDYSLTVGKLDFGFNYPNFLYVNVYSTTTNGTTYYLIHQDIYDNPTGEDYTFTVPYIPDDLLQTKPVLYTDGGIVPNSEPPRANCVHVVDEVAYYGDVLDKSGRRYKNRVMASIPSDIDSVPETFYIDLDSDVIAISSTKSTIVVLCKKGAYRLNNTQNELGQGNLLFEKISDTSTCISNSGAVQSLYGIFWAGDDGIYYTDGYAAKKLNQEYGITYRSWTMTPSGEVDIERTSRVQGKYNYQDDTIAWTFKSGFLDSDLLYVLDLKYGIRENSSFTTWSGGDSFSPTAIEFIGGELIRGDRRGFVFKHKESLHTDPRVEIDKPTTAWTTQPIMYDITTIDYDFQTSSTRKYVTEVTVACASDTNLSMNITSDSDMGRKLEDLKPVRSRSSYLWGVDSLYWGDSEYFWNIGSSVHQKRKMPGRSIRCNYKSLKFSNAKVALISSDEIGAAKVDSELKTITLLQEGREFPPSFIGHFIALQRDNYTQEFEIESISLSKNQLTLKDPTNDITPSESTLWVLRGYPKGEILNLLNVIVTYEPFGETQAAYRTSQSGEVG